MKHIVVIADTEWSKGVAAALANEYIFTYFDARHFILTQFQIAFHQSDICITNMNFYSDMIRLFPSVDDRRKIVIIAHKISDTWVIPSTACAQFTYGATSAAVAKSLEAKIGQPVFTVPDGVDLGAFPHRERNGTIGQLGWCGVPEVKAEWASAIAAAVSLPLDIAAKIPRSDMPAWYDSIDLLLVTSGPEETVETGPTAAFEAIAAGVPVIGSACGNFATLPGPKFTTIEEGTALVKELQADTDRVKALAKEQYDCVMANWTYAARSDKWRLMFEAICIKKLPEITAVLNIYKRPHTLAEQVAALRAQTVQPKAIFIWNNGNKAVDLSPYKADPLFRVFDSDKNMGVWSRFIAASMAPTEYICVFDDDTIPGPRWFENCIAQMKQQVALYGTIGVVFKRPATIYEVEKRYGWDGPSEKAMPVDIVGHAWFFKCEWYKYYFAEEPQVHTRSRNGEDIHFSHMLQKYANIPTYVPPHPPSDQSLWGSIPKTAWSYGCDGNSETFSAEYSSIHAAFQHNVDGGFRLINHRQHATSIEDLAYFCKMILERKPFAIVRPGDGEYIVMQNQTIKVLDKWTFTAGGGLATALTQALDLASKTGCHVGIPCTCCNEKMAVWYRDRFRVPYPWLTFANIFVNHNWKRWIQFLKENHVGFTLIGPAYREGHFAIEQFIQVPEYLVNDWDAQGEKHVVRILDILKKTRGKIYMFSCGPIAKIIVARAWATHPHNLYLDVGSCLDSFMKGSDTRTYMVEGSDYSKLVCKFSPEFLPA
jgi:hypothetical protein